MSNRVSDMGMDVAINRKLDSKYDPQIEKEVVSWMSEIIGESIPTGRCELQAALKNGQLLVKLINAIYQRTQNLPARSKKIILPIKFNTMSAPFKQMENIQLFLNSAEAYGVPKTSLFQTVDLFEGRNMAQVLNTLYGLGSECQRNEFQGPVCGPKPTYENKREFTDEQLAAGKTVIGLQAGTNKCASQKGMAMGGVRHIADIRCDDMSAEGAAVIGLQMGTNKGASQKGMNMGGARHIADLKVDEMSKEGQSIIGLQAGSNQGASQKGMSMGGVRHIADIKVDDMSKEGQSVIGLQAGSNKGASQAGMRMGASRHIVDIRCDDVSKEGASTIGLQMGTSQKEGASQSGMSFGAQRHIVDSH
jgi:hypothetical protein